MRGLAEEEISLDFDTQFAQSFDFSNETDGVYDDSIANDANLFLSEDPGGYEVKNVFLGLDMDCVPGIVAALGADHDISAFGQNVDYFAFTFIAPLGAYQNCIGHKLFAPRQ